MQSRDPAGSLPDPVPVFILNQSISVLLKALHAEKGIISASTFQCRGFGQQLRRKYMGKRQVAGYSVRMVTIVVQEDQTDDLFEYIFYQVNFDHL